MNHSSRLATLQYSTVPVIKHPAMCRTLSCWNALGLPHYAGKLPSSWQPIGVVYRSGPCDPSCKITRAGNELSLPQDCGSVPLRTKLDRTSCSRLGNADKLPQAEGNVPAYRAIQSRFHCNIHRSTAYQTTPSILNVIGRKLH